MKMVSFRRECRRQFTKYRRRDFTSVSHEVAGSQKLSERHTSRRISVTMLPIEEMLTAKEVSFRHIGATILVFVE